MEPSFLFSLCLGASCEMLLSELILGGSKNRRERQKQIQAVKAFIANGKLEGEFLDSFVGQIARLRFRKGAFEVKDEIRKDHASSSMASLEV